jgi:hypothetical protein
MGCELQQLLWNDPKKQLFQWEENMGIYMGKWAVQDVCTTKKMEVDWPNKRSCQEIAILGNEAGDWDIPSFEAHQQQLVGL